MGERERLYVDTIIADYRRMGRLQRWLFKRLYPFTAISARHLAEDTPKADPHINEEIK